MCGIVGVCNLNGVPVEPRLLKSMTDVIAHRGPDGEGHYADGPVGLGHRRLAVIDLSSSGDQPMFNKNRSVSIIYNGEVYNFKELRKVLQDLGYEFRSQSDTEVILHAYEEWGDRCVEQFNGMFAFAIYDQRVHLHLHLGMFEDRLDLRGEQEHTVGVIVIERLDSVPVTSQKQTPARP